MAHEVSCSAACGIFPDQGSNPCPLHWQADSSPLRHQGSPVPDFRGKAKLLTVDYDVTCGSVIYGLYYITFLLYLTCEEFLS